MGTTEYAEYAEKEEGPMTEGFLGNGQLFGNRRAKLLKENGNHGIRGIHGRRGWCGGAKGLNTK